MSRTPLTIDAFTRGYLEAALWTSDPSPGQGEWSERDEWNISRIHKPALREAITDCAAFQAANAEDLALAGDASRNGLDFFLTRNHHGAGFWDRGYGPVGKRLSDAAHVYGTHEAEDRLYRGRIYFHG